MNTTSTTAPVGFADGAAQLGLAVPDVAELVELRGAGECAGVQRRMAELVAAQLGQIQMQLGGVLADQAAAGGVGGTDGAGAMTRSIVLSQTAGRLQTAADILAGRPAATGGCSETCACTRAASVTGGAYVFPTSTGVIAPAMAADGRPIVCTLDADGGDMAGRIGQWQAMLARAIGREEIDEGIAVTFQHDVGQTAELARLLAAEYSCCSFATYSLIIDGRGVRMEIRTPPEARGAFAALFGTSN